jgi:hypothetical protein
MWLAIHACISISFLSCWHWKGSKMAMRWIALMLLLSAAPALAQLKEDPENAEPVLPDPPAVVQNAIPVSVVNAGQAAVIPAAGHAADDKACSDTNPCATPTPESR